MAIFQIIIVSFLVVVSIANATDICKTCSCFPYEDDNLVISCKNYKNHIIEIDFKSIVWPKNKENYIYKAFFNNFPLNLLPQISGDSNVISLNLDDNNIRTVDSNPFWYFANLEELSLANNRLADLRKDFFKSQTKLKKLNLSNNTLQSIDADVIEHLKELEEINLSHNLLSKITADFLDAIRNAEVVRLENNKIYAIDNAYSNNSYKIRKLFLAYNLLSAITSAMFDKLTNLEVIDLSDNKIVNIDENTFKSLQSLKLLDLSNNIVRRTVMKLPDSLELLAFNNNNLAAWPLLNIPENLTDLEIHRNQLDFIFPNQEKVPNLVKMDVSWNLIHQLPDAQFFKLEHLDLGYNLLKSIPQNINMQAPFLKDLVLDGNEISSIEFIDSTTLGSISLCNLTYLTKIGEFAFSNLSGTHITFDKTETCVAVKISNNKNLVEIDANAFYGVRFCDLDLSYNNLSKIPQNLTDWSLIENGVNLQGNPLQCTCDQEWILDGILNVLYKNDEHQELLMDLRCSLPEELSGKRLVQFLNHDNPFCGSEQVLESGFGHFLPKLLTSSDTSPSNQKIEFKLTPFTPGFIIIVALCSIILILIIIVGVKWQRDQNLRLARRNRLYYEDY